MLDEIKALNNLVADEPRIYLLSKPLFDSDVFSAFLQSEETHWVRSAASTCAEEIVELAGRVCYMSFGERQSPKSNRAYVDNLIKQKHESVLEHVSWTMLLTGVSRAFTHQLVRHRVGFSFSQLSQQYHDESQVKFVVPDEIKTDREAFRTWLRAMEALRNEYVSLSSNLEYGDLGHHATPKESRRSVRSAARSVLPNAAETKIVFSANARALRHFLRIRGSIIGDLEMRKVSALIFTEIEREAPALLSDFHQITLEDGFPAVQLRMTNEDSEI